MTALRPAFGYTQAVPEEALAAWGARLIVTQQGHVDFVPDRQGGDGPQGHMDKLFELLDERFPVSELKGVLEDLLRSGEMQTRTEEPFILYDDDELTVVANTNASAGYCYVAAWVIERKPEKTDLEKFVDAYGHGPDAARVLEVRVPELKEGGDPTPLILLHWGRYAAIVNPQGLEDHLSIDVFSFVDGQDARAGVFGMEMGRPTVRFPPEETGGTSHGCPAAAQLVVLVGKQAGEPVESAGYPDRTIADWDVNNALCGPAPGVGDFVYMAFGDSIDGVEARGRIAKIDGDGIVLSRSPDLFRWKRIIHLERVI